mmetsp:Transcript_3739/g.7723  ORF Transcript_3739/g.7723 Transcript_3739/m.7723 type:complete len:257 (-) Transcript_3739:541-1311(-)
MMLPTTLWSNYLWLRAARVCGGSSRPSGVLQLVLFAAALLVVLVLLGRERGGLAVRQPAGDIQQLLVVLEVHRERPVPHGLAEHLLEVLSSTEVVPPRGAPLLLVHLDGGRVGQHQREVHRQKASHAEGKGDVQYYSQEDKGFLRVVHFVVGVVVVISEDFHECWDEHHGRVDADDKCVEQEQQKELVVFPPHAVHHPHAVMVHLQYAAPAHGTVMAALWLPLQAPFAPTRTGRVCTRPTDRVLAGVRGWLPASWN